MNVSDLLKSRTVWGTIIAVAGALASPEVLAILPQKWAAIITAIGVVVGAIGMRIAVQNSGPTGGA